MEQKEKLSMLEEMLDLDKGALNADMELSEIEEWDSIAHLSLIVLLDDEYDRKISGNELRELKTVQEILDLMQ